MTFKTLFLFLLALTLTCTAFAQERYLKPVDEAKKDPSFLAFRQKFFVAIETKDAKFVLSAVDPKIKNGFSGNDGLEEFKKAWKLSDPNSEFWGMILSVLGNGGSFTKGTKVKNSEFWAPYIYASFPDDLDAFEHYAIIGKNVNLRKEAYPDSQIVTQLSYNIVKVDIDNSVLIEDGAHERNYSWYKVVTLGGKRGYVKSEFVRSSVDCRACFEKIKGQWKLTALISGD